MTPHEIGRAAADLLRQGYAVDIDYRYRNPVCRAGSGPAWHDRELTAALGYHAAYALRQSERPTKEPTIARRPAACPAWRGAAA